MTATNDYAAGCPIMVGRDDALAVLRDALATVLGGGNRVMMVAGEAGIGKSRLLAEARSIAEQHGLLTREGVCFPRDHAEPYAPLIDAVRLRFAGWSREEVRAACGAFAAALLPLIPDLLPATAPLPTAPSPDHERRQLQAALSQCLAESDDMRPVLLIMEDLHWSDESSLDVLFSLVRYVRRRPLLLIGTYRPCELPAHGRSWLTRLERAGLLTELALAPLTRPQVGTMVRAMLGPDAAVPEPLIDAIDSIAEGNPFHVEELARAIEIRVADGSDNTRWPAAGAPALPDSLQTAVRQRTEQLSEAARDLLKIAAVIGRRFDFALLLELTGQDEQGLLALIEELVAARLVVEESGERFAFRHALTRQAVYAGLLTRARALLHRRIGEAAEQIYQAVLDQHLGDIAGHFAQGQQWEKARQYERLAGERAVRLCASRAAVDYFTRALDAHRRTARSPAGSTGDGRTRTAVAAAIYRGRGRAYELLSEFTSARADHETANELARAAGDIREECLALLDSGVLWATRDYAEAGERYRQALALARGLADPAVLVDCLNRLGNWHANAGEAAEAIALHRQALAIVRRTGSTAGAATTHDWLGTVLYHTRDLRGSVEHFEQAAALFRELNDLPLLASCLTMLAARGGNYDVLSLDVSAADVAAGVQAAEEAIGVAQAIERPAAEAFALLQYAAILGPRGEYGRALEAAARGLAIATALEHGQWMAGLHHILGVLYLDLCTPGEALPHFTRALTLARSLGSAYWVQKAAGGLAVTYLRLHERDQAAAALAAISPDGGSGGVVIPWWATFARARLMLSDGDTGGALRLCDILARPSAGATGVDDNPHLLRLRAEALVADGQPAEARRLMRIGRDAMRRQGTLAELWRMQALLGELYRAEGQADEARREFSAARAVIEQLAANIPDDRLRERFLENATAALPRAYRLSPLTSAAAQFGGLTAREREVAMLIARGKTNNDIAQALVLGRRTVETHIANIFTKVGANSRREIAAWATSSGLAQS